MINVNNNLGDVEPLQKIINFEDKNDNKNTVINKIIYLIINFIIT